MNNREREYHARKRNKYSLSAERIRQHDSNMDSMREAIRPAYERMYAMVAMELNKMQAAAIIPAELLGPDAYNNNFSASRAAAAPWHRAFPYIEPLKETKAIR